MLLGAVTISLGTLCSRSTALAVVAMALIGFAILFAGITDGYVAAGSLVLILTFVIGVMVHRRARRDPRPARRLGEGGLAVLLDRVVRALAGQAAGPDT